MLKYFLGNFNRRGSTQILTGDTDSMQWACGSARGIIAPKLEWLYAGSTAGFGNILDGRPLWTGDFNGDGHDDVLFYYWGDGNWWLGKFMFGNQLSWSCVGNTMKKFGRMQDGRPFWTGYFNGSPQACVLFYYIIDRNWWLGCLDDSGEINFKLAGSTDGLGQIWDGRPFWTGDFTGIGKDSVLFYYPSDQNWWLGRFDDQGNLAFQLADNTSDLGQIGDGRPIWTGDFTGTGRVSVLFYYPGDQNWWLGQFDYQGKLDFKLAGNTSDLGQIGDGRPIWTGDFTGTGRVSVLFYYPKNQEWYLGQFDDQAQIAFKFAGKSDLGHLESGRTFWIGDFSGTGKDSVLFYFPGDQNWWLGEFNGQGMMHWRVVWNGSPEPEPPTTPVNQMLEVAKGGFYADYIGAYNLDEGDFTLSMMAKIESPGCLMSCRNFIVEYNADGGFTFIQTQKGRSIQWTTLPAKPAVLGDGQCHILTVVSPSQGDPTIYLDDEKFGWKPKQDLGPAPSLDQPLRLGADPSGKNPYSGGLMKVGIWRRLLTGDLFQYAGQGLLGGGLWDGLAGFWPLNGSLDDLSPEQNPFKKPSGEAKYQDCLHCVEVAGPGGALTVRVDHEGLSNDPRIVSFSKDFDVPEGAVGLAGFISDLSGNPAFPLGVVVKITSPSGAVFDGSQRINDYKVTCVPDENRTSLFSLAVAGPEPGLWTVDIHARAYVSFFFALQVFPAMEASGTAARRSPKDTDGPGMALTANGLGGWGETILGFVEIIAGAGLITISSLQMSGLALMGIGAAVAVHGLLSIQPNSSFYAAFKRVKAVPKRNVNGWLRALPDSLSIGALSLPGTHDSVAVGPANALQKLRGFWSTQEVNLLEQLDRGVRILDIRIRVDQVDGQFVFNTCHGDFGLGLNRHIYGKLEDVFEACRTFLQDAPMDFVVLSLKIDDRNGFKLSDFGPALSQSIKQNLALFLYPQDKDKLPNLGDVRGKVYCLNRIDNTNNFGVPIKIPHNTPFAELEDVKGRKFRVAVQDHCEFALSEVLTAWADKTTETKALFRMSPVWDLTLNFASANIGPEIPVIGDAKVFGIYIMNALISHIGSANPKPAFLGWLLMDFAFQEYNTTVYGLMTLVDLVIQANFQYHTCPQPFYVTTYRKDEL